MPWIHHFEYHVIASFQALSDCIELILGSGWTLVDAGYDESGLETLQICEGARTHGLDDYAGGVDPRGHLVGDLADDESQLFACVAGVVGG